MSYTEVVDGKTWTSPDGMATEDEMVGLLAALVRVMKPRLAVETGTYKGHATLAIAASLNLDGIGHLHTCDPEDPQIDWSERITFHKLNGLEMIAGLDDHSVDFAFLDGGDRLSEFKSILPKLSARAYVVIHDTRRLSEFDKDEFALLQDKYELQRLDIETPRGAWVFHSFPFQL